MNYYSIDIETCTLTPFEQGANIRCMSVYDWQTNEMRTHSERDIGLLLRDAQLLLEDSEVTLVGVNVKFDLLWLAFAIGSRLKGINCKFFDVQIAASMTVLGQPIGLEDLVVRKLGKRPYKLDRTKIAQYDLDEVIIYNRQDVEYTTQLAKIAMPSLAKHKQEQLFEVMCALIPVLVRAELKGLAIKPLAPLIAEHSKIVWATAGKLRNNYDVDPTSSVSVLTKVNGRKTDRRQLVLGDEPMARHGLENADVFSLRKLQAEDPSQSDFVNTLLEFRRSQKILSTYLTPYRHKTKLYPTYRIGKSEIGGSQFGRLACANPNLQQDPEWLLKQILAEKLIKADYGQIEWRIAAFLSRDPVMLKGLKQGLDIHTMSLAKYEHVSYAEATAKVASGAWKSKRNLHKATNFKMIYLGGVTAVMNGLLKAGEVHDYNKQILEVEEMINGWYKTYSGYIKWTKEVNKEGERSGWVRGPLGRLIRTTAFKDNQIISFLVSGFAAEISHIATTLLVEHGVQPALWVHDAIYFRCETDTSAIRKIMTEGVIQYLNDRFNVALDVPLDVTIENLSEIETYNEATEGDLCEAVS